MKELSGDEANLLEVILSGAVEIRSSQLVVRRDLCSCNDRASSHQEEKTEI